LVIGTFAGLWLLAGAIVLVSWQIRPWLFARDLKRQTPQVTQIPIALSDRSLAKLDGMRIEFYGASMDTPWQDVLRQKTFTSTAVWNFKDGANLLVMNPSNAHNLVSRVQDDPKAVRLLGKDALQSEFALMTAEMNSTPEDVKWWKLPAQNASPMTLAEFKAIHLHKYGKIYAVSFGRMRGFQEGAPDVSPYKIELNLFDHDDRQYEITILGEEGKPAPLTQTQLNSMIASIQPDSKK
jgi:hypothetical protein